MIFVTGGTGLLGAQLLFDLATRNLEVVALHRPSTDFSFYNRLFQSNPSLKEKIHWVEGDLNSIDSVSQLIPVNADVYHCAGLVSFDPRDRELLYQVNIEGTANLVNVCLEKPIRKLVHVSSVGALGRNNAEGLLINENSHWQTSKENSDYSISKYGAEREVWRGIAEGLNAVIVNPSIIIGAGNWNTGSSKLIKQVWDGLKYYTNGVSGFVDVKDVTKIMMQLMQSEISAERFLLSSENISYKKLFEMIATALGKKPPANYAAPWMGEAMWRLESIGNTFFHHKPLITKYTAITAHKVYNYDAAKIMEAMNYRFTPIEETIKRVCGEFINWKISPNITFIANEERPDSYQEKQSVDGKNNT